MNMENTKNFDQRLRDLLIISGVRREDLACHLGVSVPVVNRWLNGASVPDVYQFQSIANYFGLPYEWFLDGGDGFPGAEELAIRLGLSEETVEELLSLAAEDYDNTSVLKAVDTAVHAVLAVIDGVHEDLCRCAEQYVARMEDGKEPKNGLGTKPNTRS